MTVPDASQTVPVPQSVETGLAELFKIAPKFHTCGEEVVNWGVQQPLLWRMAELIKPGSLTLETGSGWSTVCLALIGTEHTCISPDENEHARIRQYLSENNISTLQIRFVPMKSEDFLPSLDFGSRKIDFALIDGSHAFPDPITDYFFANRFLKVGGLLAVDDIDISAVGILHKFLITEPAYELIEVNELKTGFYRKIAEPYNPQSWRSQKINANYPDLSFLPLSERLRIGLRPLEKTLKSRLGKIPGLRRGYRLLRGASSK